MDDDKVEYNSAGRDAEGVRCLCRATTSRWSGCTARLKRHRSLPIARIEAGFLLRRLQRGEVLALPHSRPMPSIGPRCHELRIRDSNHNWRIIYRVDPDAIVLVEVFTKTTRATPPAVLVICQERLRRYDGLEQE